MNSLKEKELVIRLYSDQLHSIIRPIMFSGFQSLYDVAFKVSPENGCEEFLRFLKDIPNWASGVLTTEVERIKFETKMNEYLEQLFGIIIYTIIVLMTMTPDRKKSTLRSPDDITFSRFIHMAYISGAEQLFNNSTLFIRSECKVTNQNNINQINSIIDEGIDTAITNLLPLKYILDNYVGDNNDVVTEQLKTIHDKLATDRAASHLSEKDYSSSGHRSTRSVKLRPEPTKNNSANSDSEENIIIDEKSIQPVSKGSERRSGERKSSEHKKSKQIDSEKRRRNTHTSIPLSDIPNVSVHSSKNAPNPEESEAYYKRNGKKLDIFSNREYTKVSSANHKIDINRMKLNTDSGDVNTDVVRQYVNGKKPHDSESSMQNYVPGKRTTNTKV